MHSSDSHLFVFIPWKSEQNVFLFPSRSSVCVLLKLQLHHQAAVTLKLSSQTRSSTRANPDKVLFEKCVPMHQTWTCGYTLSCLGLVVSREKLLKFRALVLWFKWKRHETPLSHSVCLVLTVPVTSAFPHNLRTAWLFVSHEPERCSTNGIFLDNTVPLTVSHRFVSCVFFPFQHDNAPYSFLTFGTKLYFEGSLIFILQLCWRINLKIKLLAIKQFNGPTSCD